MPVVKDDKSVNDTTEKLIKILSSQSSIFEVQQGLFYRTDPFELCDEHKIPSCFGNNYGGVYFSCAMEPAPGQLVPNFVEIAPGKCLSFRMGFNEAIIITGKTPPSVKYFSYCAFLNTRASKKESEAAKYFKVTPTRNVPTKLSRKAISRDILFSSLCEPINNLKINTPGTPNGALGCSYDQPFLIVFTGSLELQQQIYNAALQAGYSSDSLNTEVIPKDIVNFGVTTHETDTFSILNRISGENLDDPEMEKYLADPGISVFRVTANTITGPALPVPYLTPRGTGKTEMPYAKAVDELREKIIEFYSKEYDAVDIPTDVWLQESYTTFLQGANDMGESRDTVYLGSGTFKLPEDAFIVTYGANHAKTGKCTYSNTVVYGKNYDNGVVSVNNIEFEGSASVYLDDPVAAYLYAWRFGYYSDPSDYYTEIPSSPLYYEESIGNRHTQTIDPNEDIFLGFRAYLEPITKVGPSSNELILDRVLVFMKKVK